MQKVFYFSVIVCFLILTAAVLPITQAADVAVPGYKGPIEIIPTKDGKTLYVLNRDSMDITVTNVDDATIVATIPLPKVPNAMALSPDESTIYVGIGNYQGEVVAVNVKEGKVTAQTGVGHTPSGLVVSPDGSKLYVCYRFDAIVGELSLPELKELRRFEALHEPINAVVTLDGQKLYVANFLPHDPADGADVAAEITAIDIPTGQSKNIRLPNGSSSMHGITLSPDGKYVYTTAILARYQLPTSQLERGWTNTNGFSIIDAQKGEFVNTVLLDDVDLGAANPWPIVVSDDSTKVYVGLAGTHELCVVDIDKVLEKLSALPKNEQEAKAAGLSSAKTADNVPQDLAFLVGMKKRIRLMGKGPRSIAVIGSKVFFGMYFDDTIVVVDTSVRRPKVTEFVALGPKPEMTAARRGELNWHDATLCFQNWHSCASCHPDARTDALNWDLLNDGIGNPKNAKSMLNAMTMKPAMWHGVRESGQMAIRTGFKFLLFAVRPETDYLDIEAFLESLTPLPSPYLVDGQLSESANRGKELFESERLACTRCHINESFTDMKIHDVSSRATYDQRDDFVTPTLNEVWRTSPYMHDGRYVHLRDIFIEGSHGDIYADIDGMTGEEVDDLVAYLLSL